MVPSYTRRWWRRGIRRAEAALSYAGSASPPLPFLPSPDPAEGWGVGGGPRRQQRWRAAAFSTRRQWRRGIWRAAAVPARIRRPAALSPPMALMRAES
uniref:Uncharacterized protein n=1 Tax=Oryza meridionalis TaxID=40149 RepID=A0A0E0EAJ7_9ORYZ